MWGRQKEMMPSRLETARMIWEMIDFAACGVAMGNAIEVLKARADMVADAVDSDGIYKAFLKLQLI